MIGAAFFDLDRTLIAEGTGKVLSGALVDAGLLDQPLRGQSVLLSIFNRLGETMPTMALARRAATLSAGKSRRATSEAATSVASHLVDKVHPSARSTVLAHQAAGRPVVLATTSPYDLVKPFADSLGFDHVLATRYEVGDDGDTYTGKIDGRFVWASGKRDEVVEWAGEQHIDLAQSYAYSDSFYDIPLLTAVGRPVVVNPDPRMHLYAAVRRWPVLDIVRSDDWVEAMMQRLCVSVFRPGICPFADISIDGLEHIPGAGPVILVANHRSYFDVAILAMILNTEWRQFRMLGKQELFAIPGIGPLMKLCGGIPVDRGSGSSEPLAHARRALEAGEIVVVFPQGTVPRGGQFFEPQLHGRLGAARLAAQTGAPVVPIGLWGTEQVWPRSSYLPAVSQVGDPPKVSALVGAAVDLAHDDLIADTERIMAAIAALLPPESREPYSPTEDELAATYPPSERVHTNRADSVKAR